ncbi:TRANSMEMBRANE PROTEIN [Salix koriyanagi]|uniref:TRANSMEMBRANE PROTEIN n=1 Tax=Salix koriyanagi TaxID=2511006 RepID=A0A9Q0W3D3_9ROSI|nr:TRANSMEMBRANE PROTEIN [Salix koriyanagi]
MASTTRESRRRRIIDRGSDRLALITGQIQAIPSQKLVSEDSHPHISGEITVSPDGKDGVSDSKLVNCEPTAITAGSDGSTVETSLRGFETGVEAPLVPSVETSSKVESSLATATAQKSTRSTFRNRAKDKTTNTDKSFCLLVVLSYLGFPLVGSNFARSIIGFRPLYLLLLTNLTLVIVPLLFDNQRGFERAVDAESKIPSTDGSDWIEQAGNVMEVGLVIQKAMDAAFMDCSVYAVIIICGIALV